MKEFERLCRRGPTSDVCKELEKANQADFIVRGGFAAAIMCEKADRAGLGAYLLTCFEMFIKILLQTTRDILL